MRGIARLGLLTFTVGVLACFLAQARCSAREAPELIVEKYCLLDAKGANFSASNPNAKALLDLLINEDEAGYDTSVIIRSYKVGSARIDGTSADVNVVYSDLGTIGGELSVEKAVKTETVTFHLTLVDDAWKIDGLRILPHISQTWMLSNLRRGLKEDERAGKNDPKLRAAIAQIAQW